MAVNTEAPPVGLSSGRGFLLFKWTVYALLLVDAALLYVHAVWREVMEQTGWLMILVAFEAESRGLRWRWLTGLELAGYALAVFSWAAYARAGAWQDFANASLWLLVVAALAWDLHRPPHHGGRSWRWRNRGKAGLYAALTGIALAWGVQGHWLDAWDATLWLLCFFVIELKLFDRLGAGVRGGAGVASGG
jgi:hypothetical protein